MEEWWAATAGLPERRERDRLGLQARREAPDAALAGRRELDLHLVAVACRENHSTP